ncbi:MAG: 3'(2'),5'-bisphosphate nucleotidase CysQ [Trueperaceae bacterium]|nr:3'(2'),5'-bisphosphate nucleotidase CysQ [Trueperaceae bacterium]MCO5174936.1 3'(2'),5'-bisphosphate nucleotidase CysQ [Trueperaceae bacterium]
MTSDKTTDSDLEALRAGAYDIAKAAGEAILAIYATDFAVSTKADASPVTAADVASQDVIEAGLAKLAPGVPVIAEESPAPAFEERRTWRRFWLVDPLDGTKEFVKRNGEFSVNIALIEDGVPVLGVVHAPVAGLTYTGVAAHAGKPASAWRLDAEGNAHPIHVRPPTAEGPVRVMVSRSHANAATAAFIERLREKYGEVETIARGSAIKTCLVADGTAHFYARLGPTMWWDTAAAQAVLEAAGGAMTEASGGRALKYVGDALSNPGFVAAYTAIVAET